MGSLLQTTHFIWHMVFRSILNMKNINLMKTDLSEPVENKVSETMSYVRVWGYLKEAARLLETDGCERSEVKFKEIHNHSLVLGDETRTLWDFTPLPSGDFSRSSFSVYARQTGRLCGERWGGLHVAVPRQHDLWTQSSSSAAQTCRTGVRLS